jgi:predicted ester cyclase
MKLNASQKQFLAGLTPIEKVLYFWNNVWSPPHDLDIIDELMVEDFIITTAGKDIAGRENFKAWVAAFQQSVHDCKLENLEIFENKEQTRVVSRWKLTGHHNGMFGIDPNGKPFELFGTAIWEIRDNKLAHNWVERNAWEVYQQLIS